MCTHTYGMDQDMHVRNPRGAVHLCVCVCVCVCVCTRAHVLLIICFSPTKTEREMGCAPSRKQERPLNVLGL
jgi:hypothetical protein